jgi:purine-nucleoside phosphorylase
MTEAYDARLRKAMRTAAAKAPEPLRKGVYMWFSGPSFETPAEIRMARILGADAVGMSTVPEVIIARFFGLKVAACLGHHQLGAGMTGAS